MSDRRFTFRIDWLERIVKLTLLIAGAVLLGIIAWRLERGRGKPLVAAYAPSPIAALGSLPANRRVVRNARRGHVVCSEPPRSSFPASGDKNTTPAAAVASTLLLREAGWQLCGAFANGAITRQQYGTTLLTLVDRLVPASPVSVAASPVATRPADRTRRRGLKTRCRC